MMIRFITLASILLTLYSIINRFYLIVRLVDLSPGNLFRPFRISGKDEDGRAIVIAVEVAVVAVVAVAVAVEQAAK